MERLVLLELNKKLQYFIRIYDVFIIRVIAALANILIKRAQTDLKLITK